ncbi:MAG: hypothetical protein K2V38_12460, partial [Gemmataceae bacterium]|nr:hypothetical protein [Gemmataceae bacterium]
LASVVPFLGEPARAPKSARLSEAELCDNLARVFFKLVHNDVLPPKDLLPALQRVEDKGLRDAWKGLLSGEVDKLDDAVQRLDKALVHAKNPPSQQLLPATPPSGGSRFPRWLALLLLLLLLGGATAALLASGVVDWNKLAGAFRGPAAGNGPGPEGAAPEPKQQTPSNTPSTPASPGQPGGTPGAAPRKKIAVQELVIYRKDQKKSGLLPSGVPLPKQPLPTSPLPEMLPPSAPIPGVLGGANPAAPVLKIDTAKKEQTSTIPIKPDHEPWRFTDPGEDKVKEWLKAELVRIAQTQDVNFEDKNSVWRWVIKDSPVDLSEIQDELLTLTYDLVVPATGKGPEQQLTIRFKDPLRATHGTMYLRSGDNDGDSDGSLKFTMTARDVETPYGNDRVWTSLEVIPLVKSKDDANPKNVWRLDVVPGQPAKSISFAPRFNKPYSVVATRESGKEQFSKIVFVTQSEEDMEDELTKLFQRAQMSVPDLKKFYRKIDDNYYAIKGVPLFREISRQFNPKADPSDPENQKRRDKQDKDRVYDFLP